MSLEYISMTDLHTIELFNIGKILYQNKNLSPSQSLMCFGFECPDIWFEILKKLSLQLEEINNTYNIQIVADQVKEKFGYLHFYYSINSNIEDENEYKNICEQIEQHIHNAEQESWKICCICGKKASLTSEGWIMRYCEQCANNSNRFKKDKDI